MVFGAICNASFVKFAAITRTNFIVFEFDNFSAQFSSVYFVCRWHIESTKTIT